MLFSTASLHKKESVIKCKIDFLNFCNVFRRRRIEKVCVDKFFNHQRRTSYLIVEFSWRFTLKAIASVFFLISFALIFKMSQTTKQIVIIGDGTVGKTCLLHCYSNESFLESYVPTVWVFSFSWLLNSKLVFSSFSNSIKKWVEIYSPLVWRWHFFSIKLDNFKKMHSVKKINSQSITGTTKRFLISQLMAKCTW